MSLFYEFSFIPMAVNCELSNSENVHTIIQRLEPSIQIFIASKIPSTTDDEYNEKLLCCGIDFN